MITWIVMILGAVLGFASVSTLTRASLTTLTNQLAMREGIPLAVAQVVIGMLPARVFLGIVTMSLGFIIHGLFPAIEKYQHYIMPILGTALVIYGLSKSGLFAWWLSEVEVKLISGMPSYNLAVTGLMSSVLPNGPMVYAMAFGMLTFPEHALLLFLVSAAGSGVALAILAFKARSSMETGMSFVDIELLVRLTGVMLLTMGFVLIACIKLF